MFTAIIGLSDHMRCTPIIVTGDGRIEGITQVCPILHMKKSTIIFAELNKGEAVYLFEYRKIELDSLLPVYLAGDYHCANCGKHLSSRNLSNVVLGASMVFCGTECVAKNFIGGIRTKALTQQEDSVFYIRKKSHARWRGSIKRFDGGYKSSSVFAHAHSPRSVYETENTDPYLRFAEYDIIYPG